MDDHCIDKDSPYCVTGSCKETDCNHKCKYLQDNQCKSSECSMCIRRKCQAPPKKCEYDQCDWDGHCLDKKCPYCVRKKCRGDDCGKSCPYFDDDACNSKECPICIDGRCSSRPKKCYKDPCNRHVHCRNKECPFCVDNVCKGNDCNRSCSYLNDKACRSVECPMCIGNKCQAAPKKCKMDRCDWDRHCTDEKCPFCVDKVCLGDDCARRCRNDDSCR